MPDMLIWVFALGMVAEAIMIVVLIMWYVSPARSTPAMMFINAKKKNKPVLFLDNGSFYKVCVGVNEGAGFIEDSEGSKVMVHPNSIKYARGVRVGIGEYYRSIVTTPLIIRFIELAKKMKLEPKETKEIMETIEKEIDEGKFKELENVPEEEN